MITERVLNKDIIDSKVKIGVIFNNYSNSGAYTKYYEGVVVTIGAIGKESFVVLDNNILISLKHIQTIEIIG